jgi:CoA-dependent NAD(P)H sulfur oxidoreductase
MNTVYALTVINQDNNLHMLYIDGLNLHTKILKPGVPLATTANKQGRIAGENAAGGNTVFRGIAGSAILKSSDLYLEKMD